MKHRTFQRFAQCTLCSAFLMGAAIPDGMAGLAEPPIIYYGMVTNKVGDRSRPVLGGSMKWVITPSGGTPFTILTDLTPLPGGFSYRLEIPVQKLVGISAVPAGAISATAKSTPFGVRIEVNGEIAEVVRGGDGLQFAENQRGKLARVDVRTSRPFEDSDGDGLPDWWEDEFAALGFDKFNPNDALGDLNGDGVSNLDEYRKGTDPGRVFLTYAEWAATRNLTGPDAGEGGDFDFDGVLNVVEFAVDSDPRVPDRALVEQRAAASVVDFGRRSFIKMRCAMPDAPRKGIRYIVEASGDLKHWKRLENTKAEGNDLLVSETQSLEFTAARPRFIRLRIASDNSPSLVADAGIWGARDQTVPRQRGGREGQALLAAPFERAVLGQGEATSFLADSVTDSASAWPAGQWTNAAHLVTFTSGLLQGRTFAITAQSGQVLTLDTQGVDLSAALAVNERFDIRPAPTLANLFGDPPRNLRTGAGNDADMVALGNGNGLDDFAHDGTSWLQIGQTDDRGETIIYPEEGFFIRNRGQRPAKLRFFGLVPRESHAVALPDGETLVGSGTPFLRSLAETGLAQAPGWTSADQMQLWTGQKFKNYHYDGLHWRTDNSGAAQDRVKIKGGAAIRILRPAGSPPLLWEQTAP